MPRAMWSGAISFGLVHIPVELYSAEKKHELDLSMVDRRDFSPIGYKRFNKKTGKEVEWDDIVKAYAYEDDQYVVLSDEDLKRANVKATQTIDILSFADAEEIPPTYFEQPYYLAPGKGGDKVYALLRETLRKSGKVGIAQIVIRTRQHLVALMPVDKVIVVNTLRYQSELKPTEELDVPASSLKSAGISAKEIEMATSLVESMTEPWDPTGYRDTYRDDVLALVKKKIKANQTKTITQPDDDGGPPAPGGGAQIIDLMALLKESLGSAGRKPPTGSGSAAGHRNPSGTRAVKKTAPASRSTAVRSASEKLAVKAVKASAPRKAPAEKKTAASRRA
ncbi:Ku protein [soil metagenome]